MTVVLRVKLMNKIAKPNYKSDSVAGGAGAGNSVSSIFE